MAPEQVLGLVSGAADVSVCGAVALEMLTGRRMAVLGLPANNQDLELTAARSLECGFGWPSGAGAVLARVLPLWPGGRFGLAPMALAGVLAEVGCPRPGGPFKGI